LNRLIVAAGVSATFEGIPGIDLRIFWRDAIIAATAATKLAPKLGADAEEAYIGGLLYATGHLILCQAYPEIADAMFTGFAVVRGSELAAIELECFGIDHSTAGALWVETLGFPPAVTEAIRALSAPLSEAPAPLALTLASASALVLAVAEKQDAEAALKTLPAAVQAKFSDAAGGADASFCKLYETLEEIEPAF
jgi:HD-like signal output (HDOD) protein